MRKITQQDYIFEAAVTGTGKAARQANHARTQKQAHQPLTAWNRQTKSTFKTIEAESHSSAFAAFGFGLHVVCHIYIHMMCVHRKDDLGFKNHAKKLTTNTCFVEGFAPAKRIPKPRYVQTFDIGRLMRKWCNIVSVLQLQTQEDYIFETMVAGTRKAVRKASQARTQKWAHQCFDSETDRQKASSNT